MKPAALMEFWAPEPIRMAPLFSTQIAVGQGAAMRQSVGVSVGVGMGEGLGLLLSATVGDSVSVEELLKESEGVGVDVEVLVAVEVPVPQAEALLVTDGVPVGVALTVLERLTEELPEAVAVGELSVVLERPPLSTLILHCPPTHVRPASQAAGTLSCVQAAPKLAFTDAASDAGPQRRVLSALGAPPLPNGATSVRAPLLKVVIVKAAPGAHAAACLPWQDRLCALHCIPDTQRGAASGEPGRPARATSHAAQEGAADMPRAAAGPR
jgi:hypothetical protein